MSELLPGGVTHAANGNPAAIDVRSSGRLYKALGLSLAGLAATVGAVAGVPRLTEVLDHGNTHASAQVATPAPPLAVAAQPSAPPKPAPPPAAARPTTPPHPGLLEEGDSGSSVKQMQSALGTTRADGIFGPKTRAAVVAFQRSHGLAVDGIVGPHTRASLFHPPAPAHKNTSYHSSSSSSHSYSSTSGGFAIPSYIVMCESGGNYSAVNASGAGGAYQIMPSTWRAYGGSGLPQNASPAEQNAIAAKIYAAQGSAPWSCAR